MNDSAPKNVYNQNVTSSYQSGGITAHTVNVHPIPRTVNPEVERDIARLVPRDKMVSVWALMGDAEACLFAEELNKYLLEQNYKVDGPGISQAVWQRTPVGTTVLDGPTECKIIVGTNRQRR